MSFPRSMRSAIDWLESGILITSMFPVHRSMRQIPRCHPLHEPQDARLWASSESSPSEDCAEFCLASGATNSQCEAKNGSSVLAAPTEAGIFGINPLSYGTSTRPTLQRMCTYG